jgi:hypothetical protein
MAVHILLKKAVLEGSGERVSPRPQSGRNVVVDNVKHRPRSRRRAGVESRPEPSSNHCMHACDNCFKKATRRGSLDAFSDQFGFGLGRCDGGSALVAGFALQCPRRWGRPSRLRSSQAEQMPIQTESRDSLLRWVKEEPDKGGIVRGGFILHSFKLDSHASSVTVVRDSCLGQSGGLPCLPGCECRHGDDPSACAG